MKKSFKKSIAVLLAVLMVVCTFPLTAFAAEKPNINLQFGVFTLANSASSRRTYTASRKGSDYASANSGLMNAKLDYNKSTGTLYDPVDSYTYAVGDYFTATVLLENVSQLAATQVAINYSSNIAPAGIANDRTAFAGETSGTISNVFYPGEPVAAQSAHALYNTVTTVGEQSYIDMNTNTMYAIFATQDGGDYANTASTAIGVETFSNTAVLATFAFKITAAGPISFSLANTTEADDAYYLGTLENGGDVSEYITYAPSDNAGSTGLDFMGGNEYVAAEKYTIKFLNEDGSEISSAEYIEGETVTVPDLPATTHDDTYHYTYRWSPAVSETAVANATYQVAKTAAEHTWDAGVEAGGTKTYTCTFEGCGATKTEQVEVHVHSWSEWAYNNDAVYVNSSNHTDGTASRTCSTCGETETKTIAGTGLLRANGASVELASAVILNVNFNESRTTAFDETYCVINYLGRDYRIDEYVVSGSNRVYAFDQIAPKYFVKNVVITMYGVKDGIVCKGHSVNYSIKQYLYNQLGKNPTPNKQKLLIETMYYGEADQIFNGETEDLITADLTEEQRAIHTLDVPTYKKITAQTDNPNPANDIVTWRSGGLELSGAVYVKYTIELGGSYNLDDYTFHFVLDGVDTQVSHKTNPELFVATTPRTPGNQAYVVTFDKMASHQYSKPINSYVTDTNGVQVSKTLTYSAESFATSSTYKNNPAVALLVDQMLRYGRANIAFRENPNA